MESEHEGKQVNDFTIKRRKSEKRVFITGLPQNPLPDKIGNKAANLDRLMKKKVLTPKTWVLNWDAYREHSNQPEAVLEKVEAELREIILPGQSYAVRSSADVEDSSIHSFAGQFYTFLNVEGIENVLKAIQKVWKAVDSQSLQAYLQRSQTKRDHLYMAVIIQEMVPPVISGVSFSINPITSLDEIVVEAVRGSGEQLVQEGAIPMHWVSKWGKWIEKPESEVIGLEFIQKVVTETQKISRTFKMNVDLEWVYDGKDIYWVQMRDITALGKANIYSNKIAKEMTPGLVKPLEWSVIVPIKSEMWMNVLRDVIGKNEIDPNSLAKSFNYRVYHNLGVFGRVFESLGLPRESLDIMMGVAPPGAGRPPFKPGFKFIRLTPRIVRFLWEKWNFASKAEKAYPLMHSEARSFQLEPASFTPESHLITLIDLIRDLNLRITTHTFTSILLMQIYSGLLNSQLKKAGVDFSEFDLMEGMDELGKYDPNKSLEALHEQFLQLDEELRCQIEAGGYEEFRHMPGIVGFRESVEQFLAEFGHMSDRTVMFDTIPWRETPDLILKLIANFEPHKRFLPPMIRYEQIQRRGMGGVVFKMSYQRARQFRIFREKYSSLYTYSLMLFRVYYLELANRLVSRDVLDSKEDIYFLYDWEIRQYISGEISGKEFKGLIRERKDEFERCKFAVPPEIIFGDVAPPIVIQTDHRLKGTPTSQGYYTGKTKIVRGMADFTKLAQGDVLVIPYSEVGMLPLFAKAGAVIAESGGMLSHSSIVAREYRIPAVVSVHHALQILKDDILVSIDGYKGEIIIHTAD